MDVILIDDKEGEGALLVREWEPHGVRVLHSDDLRDVDVMIKGGQPEGWPDPPYSAAAAIIDLDLGHRGPGPAGGVVAAHRINRWTREVRRPMPIVLRTADVDDDRSLAAVLAAELLDQPLPLWGKTAKEADDLLRYLEACRRETANPVAFGAAIVHPVRFVREERGHRLLGDFLYEGSRADVWERLQGGFDPETAIMAAGFKKHHKFWEPQNGLVSAIMHLRHRGTFLHQLGGRTIRVSDVEREIVAEVIADIGIAIYAVNGLTDTTEDARDHIIDALELTRAQYVDWLENGGRRPNQNRNVDQGEFLGAFGRVLGHPEIVDLFRH